MLTKIKDFLTSPWRAARLQAFKDFVHARLDDAGVDPYPGGEHSEAGCRIGDRLDILVRRANHAPCFTAVALRDHTLGAEIVAQIKEIAIEKLTPVLSREYLKVLGQIAWEVPCVKSTPSSGTVFSALEMTQNVYHVRIRLPQLDYDLKVTQ